MRKLMALCLALMLLPAAALAEAPAPWSMPEDMTVTEECAALLDRALEELVGVVYEPVSYLGSQTAEGVRHCFLCRATVVYPGAMPALALVYVLEFPEGEVSVDAIVRLDLDALAMTE